MRAQMTAWTVVLAASLAMPVLMDRVTVTLPAEPPLRVVGSLVALSIPDFDNPVTFNYDTFDASAVASTATLQGDYNPTSLPFTFAPGQTTGVITHAFTISVGDIYATPDGNQLLVNARRQVRTYRLGDALPYPPVAEKNDSK